MDKKPKIKIPKQKTDQQILHKAACHALTTIIYETYDQNTRGQNTPAYVEQALVYLQKHLQEEISLSSIADKLGVTQAHLSREFKKAIGISPLKYHHKLRIELAGDFLKESNAPLAVIATRLGFSNEFHFSKLFKRITGQSPGAYRRHI